jgi:16S rRNA processing protein RimM
MPAGNSNPDNSQNVSLPAGSPSTGEPEFLAVGKLRRAHGLRGEMLVDVYTDFPERLHSGVTVYVGETHQAHRIRGRRVHGAGMLLAFDGYQDAEAVGSLRNQVIYVRADDRPALPEGEYYHHQLIGLRVLSEEGQFLGTVVEILETGSNDVLVIRPESGPEILVPLIDQILRGIDLEKGEMRIYVMPGLIQE